MTHAIISNKSEIQRDEEADSPGNMRIEVLRPRLYLSVNLAMHVTSTMDKRRGLWTIAPPLGKKSGFRRYSAGWSELPCPRRE